MLGVCLIRLLMGVAVLGAASTGCNNGHGAGDSTAATPRLITVAAPVTNLVSTAAAPSDKAPHVNSIPEARLVEPERGDFKPHRLQLRLETFSHVMGIYTHDPYVSDDGSTAIVLVSSEGGKVPETLLIRPLDGKTPNSEIPLLNDECDLLVNMKCPRPKAEKQIAIANKFLAKHRWVKFRSYVPDHPDTMESGCGTERRDRHFRIPDFEVKFESDNPSKDAHLRIVRDDGAVITDSDIDVHSPDESEECRRGTMPYLNDLGVDNERRAMYVFLSSCHTEGCPSDSPFLFFRLPPPLPKAGEKIP